MALLQLHDDSLPDCNMLARSPPTRRRHRAILTSWRCRGNLII
jgi:hypothetical protein